jgi:hypothetical protein
MSAKLVVHPKTAEQVRRREAETKVEKQHAKLEREMDSFLAVIDGLGDRGLFVDCRGSLNLVRSVLRRSLMREGFLPIRREWL